VISKILSTLGLDRTSANARFERSRRALVSIRAVSPRESRKVQPVKSTITSPGSSATLRSVFSSPGVVAMSTSPMTETTGVPLSSSSVAAANLWLAPGVTRRVDWLAPSALARSIMPDLLGLGSLRRPRS
jgi:hypothetical protein